MVCLVRVELMFGNYGHNRNLPVNIHFLLPAGGPYPGPSLIIDDLRKLNFLYIYYISIV